MNTYNYDGCSVAYVKEGKGSPLIFLHNGGTSHAIWNAQIADLAQNYCVYALDLPGYGASEKSTTGYSLEAYVALLAAFIEHYQLNKVSLVGNCMGSAISLLYAATNREKVSHIIAINPLSEATFIGGSIGALHSLNRRLPKITKPIADLALNISVPPWAVLPSVAPLLGWRGIKQGIYKNKALHACLQLPNQSESLVGLFLELDSFSTIDNLPADDKLPPICTIWGEQNKVLSAKAGRQLNIKLKPKRKEFIADCGHLPMLERPEEITEIIRDFLDNRLMVKKEKSVTLPPEPA